MRTQENSTGTAATQRSNRQWESVPINALMVTDGTTPRLSAEAHSSHTAWVAKGEFAGRFEERRVIGRQSNATGAVRMGALFIYQEWKGLCRILP